MPNLTYMAVQWCYLTALAVWVGGIIGFAALFVPSMAQVLERADTGRVIAAFLPRFRVAVASCVAVLLLTSVVKFAAWETLTGWLLARWLLLGAMAGLALYDFRVLAPRLIQARAAGDRKSFDRQHRSAVATLSATCLMGLGVLFLS